MKVAVIGAGISGVVTGAHLKNAGIDYTVFERSAEAGGVWLYDERLPPEPAYPATLPSEGDSIFYDDQTHTPEAFRQSRHEKEILKHAPPGPCYEGLTNNVSTRLMKLKLNSWPPGTPDFVNHSVLNAYIQDTAWKTGVHDKTLYSTRVEDVSKKGAAWNVRTSTLPGNGGCGKRSEREWDFDAVIVASGHYHACRVPDIPGLAKCKASWPGRVQHSKSYRSPTGLKDQNILLIGAGVSSTDIAREIGPGAGTIYQTSRGGTFDLPSSFLPPNATRIKGELDRIDTLCEPSRDLSLDGHHVLPIKVIFKDGRELKDIHRIILCTGYTFTLPFLRPYHNDNLPACEANDQVLVTDGTQLHNLHKDIFYIPDPTLVFVGVPFFTANFSLFEFQAIAVAAVLAGQASLPGQEDMWREYWERVQRKGTGKGFHSLKEKEVEYVNELVGWLNRDRAGTGAALVEGHTPEWHVANIDRIEKVRRIMEEKRKDAHSVN